MHTISVVLTGASGLLGRAVYRQFKASGNMQIEGLAFQRATPDFIKLDLLEQTAVENYIRKTTPAVIIHAAAERRPDVGRANPELVRALNVTATQQLVKLARETGAWFVYISTDYVFDGTQPPYSPHSLPHPLNLYGQTKYEGETIVRETLDSYLILRVPILYGEVEYLGESAVTDLAGILIKSRKQSVHIEYSFDNWAIRFPTYTTDVAVVLKELIELKQQRQDLSGIFHWSGNKAMTKYEMACVLADLLSLDSSGLKPVTHPPAGGEPRPQNSHLDISDTLALIKGQQSNFIAKMRSILSTVR